jgi:uncharacterized membrane protein HdeD (DUF308 family)
LCGSIVILAIVTGVWLDIIGITHIVHALQSARTPTPFAKPSTKFQQVSDPVAGLLASSMHPGG